MSDNIDINFLEDIEPLEENSESENSDVQIEVKPKLKKPKTEKQMAAFAKVVEKRKENVRLRKEEKEIEEQEKKKILELKLIHKAISVKKKQLKKERILDEISDDDSEPIVQKQKVKSKPKQIIYQEPEKPKFSLRFV